MFADSAIGFFDSHFFSALFKQPGNVLLVPHKSSLQGHLTSADSLGQ